MRLLGYFSKWAKSHLVTLGLTLAVSVGLVDYLTGSELSFSIFYLIPISLVAWLVGRRAGILISVVSAICWLVADSLTGHTYSHPAILYWNAIVRLGFFLIVTVVLSSLRATQERREELGLFIVHDLRSPLSNVITGLHTLQEIAGETADATQRSLVEMCLVSSNRMLTLINSLLDVGRLESRRMPLEPSECSVRGLVEASLGQVSVWAGRNRVTLASQLEPGAETVYADPTVTARILVNLLSNAIKFSHPESVVTIRAAPGPPGFATFSVTDQGHGIPEEWIDRVFDKFAQVEARRADRVVGSGLGLTFCRLAVQAQGGRIWLESAAGKGTTVTFTLPVA